MGRRVVIFRLLSLTRRPRASKKAALLVRGRLETQPTTRTNVFKRTFLSLTQEALVCETARHVDRHFLLKSHSSLSRPLSPTQVLKARFGLRRPHAGNAYRPWYIFQRLVSRDEPLNDLACPTFINASIPPVVPKERILPFFPTPCLFSH